MQKIKDMSGKSRALYIVISALCLALACWACTSTLRTWVQVASVIIMMASLLMIILLLIPRAGAEKSQDSPFAPQLQQLVHLGVRPLRFPLGDLLAAHSQHHSELLLRHIPRCAQVQQIVSKDHSQYLS